MLDAQEEAWHDLLASGVPEIEVLAARNAPREEIERSAAAGGMRSLWDDGIAKAAAGLTSIEELARVVSM